MTFVGAILAGVLGLAAGFVVNLLLIRLTRGRPLLGPLGCTAGTHSIRVWQAIPVLGYLLQRGQCSLCGGRLSWIYPLIEAVVALLFASLYMAHGWGLQFLFSAIYTVLLMVVLVIDWAQRDIYLSVIAVGSAAGLVGSLLLAEVGLWSALGGAAVAAGFFALAYVLARVLFPRIEEPLGLGDVFLALMMGLMLGFPSVVGALLIGPLIAGVAVLLLLLTRRARMGDMIPYGVALCAAAILFLVYPGPFAEALKLDALRRLVTSLFGQS